jgi:hypothetical protein
MMEDDLIVSEHGKLNEMENLQMEEMNFLSN